MRIGADGIFSAGGSIDARLLGNPLDFSASDTTGETIRGFVGFDALYTTTGGTSFPVGAELGYDSSDAFTAQAEAGFEIPLQTTHYAIASVIPDSAGQERGNGCFGSN